MPIIAFVSQHGGVGVTTSAVTVAYGLTSHRKKTLLMDLQELAQCSLALGLKRAPAVHEWLVGGKSAWGQATTMFNGLAVLCGDQSTASVNSKFNCEPDGLQWLEAEMQLLALDRKAWIVVDTPRRQILGDAVIATADMIVIPFRCDAHSWHGTMNTIALVKKLNPDAKVWLLPTQFDYRQSIEQHYLNEATRLYGEQVAQPVPRRIAVAESGRFGLSIWHYDKEGMEEVRATYRSLIHQLLSWTPLGSEEPRIRYYERRIEALESVVSALLAWCARYDMKTRLDQLEEDLDTTWSEVNAMRQPLQEMALKWDKLRSLFDEEPSAS